jgi:hypothetical protein
MHAFISFHHPKKSNIQPVTLKDLSCQANLKNTSERFIKSIVDLRKKIYNVQEKLDSEMKVSWILGEISNNFGLFLKIAQTRNGEEIVRGEILIENYKLDSFHFLQQLRKDISRQKKSLSVRRNTHNHTPMASSTIATSLTHCPSIVSSQSQMGQSCSSLPPIKKPILAK